MNKRIFRGIMFVLAGVTIAVFGTSPWWLEPIGYIYNGKALMDKAEYQEFKQLMASDEVNNYSVDILNTDYPVLIQYEFSITTIVGTSSVKEEKDTSNVIMLCAYDEDKE